MPRGSHVPSAEEERLGLIAQRYLRLAWAQARDRAHPTLPTDREIFAATQAIAPLLDIARDTAVDVARAAITAAYQEREDSANAAALMDAYARAAAWQPSWLQEAQDEAKPDARGPR
jgi:hypothetical protein